MKVISSLNVDKFVTYNAAKLDLTCAPVTVIRGRNLDRKDKKSANASGKSLLMSSLGTLFFAKPPTADKSKSAREMFIDKTGNISVDVQSDGNNYRISQYVKGVGTLAYRVVENGKDLNYNKAGDAIAKIRKIFPLTEEQFYAFVYLDSRNYHVLQRGTPQARFEFFENVFNLGIYETIAKAIGKRYTAVKDFLRDLKIYETEFAVKRSQLKVTRIQYDKMARDIEAYKNTMGSAQKELQKLYENVRRCDSYLMLTQDMSDKEVQFDLNRMKEIYAGKKSDYNEMVEMTTEAYKFKEYEERRKQIIQECNKLKRQFDEIELEFIKIPSISREDAIIGMNESNTFLTNNRYVESDWNKLEQFGFDKNTRNKIVNMGEDYIVKKLAYNNAKIDSVKKSISNLQSVIDHVRNHNNAQCPYCQQTLDVASAQNTIVYLRKECIQLDRNVKNFSKALDFLQAYNYLPDPSIEKYKEKIQEAKNNYNKYREIIEKWNARSKLQVQKDVLERTFQKLMNEYDNIPVDEGEMSKKIKPYEELKKQVKEQLDALELCLTRRKKLVGFPPNWTPSFIKSKQLEFKRRIEKFQPYVTKIQAGLQKLTVDFAQAQALYTDLVRLREKINKLKTLTKDAKSLEVLREAFGPKGLRRNRIAALAEMFTTNLNRFSSLVYGEKILFQTKVGENSFDILATRNNGKTSDVRLLSGSEDKAFRLLSLLSILPFIPAKFRTNLVVLDEMESGLDPVSKRLFVNEFIPMLNSIIPNIVIITPQSEAEFYVPNARTIVVEKKNGISRIIEGIRR